MELPPPEQLVAVRVRAARSATAKRRRLRRGRAKRRQARAAPAAGRQGRWWRRLDAVPEPEVVMETVAVEVPETGRVAGREQAGRFWALAGMPVRVQERLTVPVKAAWGVRVRVALPPRPGWAMATVPLVAREKLGLVVPLRVARLAVRAGRAGADQEIGRAHV